MKYYLNFSEVSNFFAKKELGLYNNYFIYFIENDLGNFNFVIKYNKFNFINNNKLVYFFKNRYFICFLRNVNLVMNLSLFGYYKELVLVGLGFKILRNRFRSIINFELQFSHKLIYKIPKDILIKTSKKNIIVFGLSKDRVNDVSNEIKSLRFPNVYTGTGIKFKNESIKLKPGKQR